MYVPHITQGSIKRIQETASASSRCLFYPYALAVLYVFLDRQEESRAAANKALELFPDFSVEHIAKGLPFKNQAFHKLFVDAMRKAGLK
jgi:hypothetical protein